MAMEQHLHEQTAVHRDDLGGPRAESDRFLRRRLELLIGVVDNPFPVLVTHMTSEPDVEACAQAQNVALYYSYDF